MPYIGNSPANVGNYQVVDDISSTFNGVLTSFALTASSLAINPAKSGQLLVSINGVLQEPDDTGTEGFKVSGSNIVFSSAPATGSTFWAVWQGQAVDIGTPSDGVVGTAQMSSAELALTGGLSLGDNVKANFGASDDLQIYHSGSNSHITDAGTGNLYIKATNGVLIQDNDTGTNRLTTSAAGSVNLYHAGNLKLNTTSAGIDVTGSVTCDGFTSTGIDDNATSTAITIGADEVATFGQPIVAPFAYDDDTTAFIANTLASGAIIEQGSNANGRYIKYADGSAIAYKTTHTTGLSILKQTWYRLTVPPSPITFVTSTTQVTIAGRRSDGNPVYVYGGVENGGAKYGVYNPGVGPYGTIDAVVGLWSYTVITGSWK